MEIYAFFSQIRIVYALMFKRIWRHILCNLYMHCGSAMRINNTDQCVWKCTLRNSKHRFPFELVEKYWLIVKYIIGIYFTTHISEKQSFKFIHVYFCCHIYIKMLLNLSHNQCRCILHACYKLQNDTLIIFKN